MIEKGHSLNLGCPFVLGLKEILHCFIDLGVLERVEIDLGGFETLMSQRL